MQLYRIGFVSLSYRGEIHLGFVVEERCRKWIVINNGLASEYDGLPFYSFLGVLNAS